MVLATMAQLWGGKNYQVLNEIRVSQSALAHNHEVLQQLLQMPVAPVLKSNAYGHGLHITAKIFDELKPAFLVVDSLYEAYELLPLKLKTPVLVMGYTKAVNLKRKPIPFQFCVFDFATAAALNQAQKHCQIHVFVDTGMYREGVPLDELPSFIQSLQKLPNLEIVGVCSHLAMADMLDRQATTSIRQQTTKFRKAVATLQSLGIQPKYQHLSASAGALRKLAFTDTTLARVGIAHYGLVPSPEMAQKATLQPALQFVSTIVQIKTLQVGDQVGYAGTFTAKKPLKIAVVPAGYYEGVDRRLSNVGVMKVAGVYCPIVGRVSMNMTVIDISQVAAAAAVGDEVEIYSAVASDQNSIENSALACQTIPYELLVHLAASVRRRVVDCLPAKS